MEPKAGSVRYERKFIPPTMPLEHLLALLRQHPAGFREVYAPRFVNSIYLDTPDLADFHDHVAGLPSRSKTRIRWYGPLQGHVPGPILERKYKTGHVGWKQSHPLPPFHLNGNGWAEPIRSIDRSASLPDRIRAPLHQRQPVLLTRYLRRYFLSRDGRFRLTLDTDLAFDTALRPQGHARLIPSPVPVVLELKFAPDAAADADRITRAFPFRITRCSKYVLGTSLLLFGAD
jgi:hypothetical protein